MDFAAPFDRASDRLKPIVAAHGFRLASVEREGGKQGHAFAEFYRREMRLRLVWEGRERVLWVETARQLGSQVVSRWWDVEWSLAGEPLPLDRDTSDDRIARLADAVMGYLDRIGSLSASRSALPTSNDTTGDRSGAEYAAPDPAREPTAHSLRT